MHAWAREVPRLIQGGMGIGVSSWRLAAAVASTGALGVVSGTAPDTVLVRRLQDGDSSGDARRALAHFPVPALAERVLEHYFRPDGRPPGAPYALIPKLRLDQSRAWQELAVVASFVEVWLAKQGHTGVIGVNFLEKVQMATPTAAYGAMLAGADVVLMGAGIPREMPRLLDALARHRAVSLPVDVIGARAGDRFTVDLDPADLLGTTPEPLRRPRFLAIVSAHALADYLARDPLIRPDGFVVEGPPAGGHNAPPRGRLVLDQGGQPVYGPRDLADITKLSAIGLPFWLAGGYGSPDRLQEALAAGATGVQVGTAFALCRESGLRPDLRAALLDRMRDHKLEIRTDPAASPTGFPFKVAQLDGTLSDPDVYAARVRQCDLGYLRVPYLRENGSVGYRCSAEPVAAFVRKGGAEADTAGKACLCNALTADIGLAQTRRSGYTEPALVTLGADLDGAHRLLDLYPEGWTAPQVVSWLLG